LRFFYSGLASAAVFVVAVGCLGGSSGCSGGKPADGTMIDGAPPLSAEQKAMHKRFYDRTKKRGMRKTGKR
jgi:hypothetical protein